MTIKLVSPLSPRFGLDGPRPRWRSRGRVQIILVTAFLLLIGHGVVFHVLDPALISKLSTPAASADNIRLLIASGGRPFPPDRAWSSEEDEDNKPLLRLGHNTARVNVTAPIIDLRSGLPIDEETNGGPFNLAILKLPRGSKWDFVGVARGPTRTREFMKVEGHVSREQSLIGMGLDMNAQGGLTVVSDAYMFDYQLIPKPGCIKSGGWVATYGAEDARLFWTDAGTPGMTFARNSEFTHICRSIGFIPDLRIMFPALADALVPSKQEGVVAYNGFRRPGEPTALELARADRPISYTEKNWAAFYPGPEPTGEIVPHVNYFVSPFTALQPLRNDSDIRRVWYEAVSWPQRTTVLSAAEIAAEKARLGEQAATAYAKSVEDSATRERSIMESTLKCVQNAHHSYNPAAMHQASPLYRLTLGDRGCRATAANTVNFAVFHIKTNQKDFNGMRRYVKFFVTFNITAPYAPISVGPGFSVDGLNLRDINFALSLTPLEAHDLNHAIAPKRTPRAYLPSHFFADDEIMITFGVQDEEMATTVLSMEEALSGHMDCGAGEGLE